MPTGKDKFSIANVYYWKGSTAICFELFIIKGAIFLGNWPPKVFVAYRMYNIMFLSFWRKNIHLAIISWHLCIFKDVKFPMDRLTYVYFLYINIFFYTLWCLFYFIVVHISAAHPFLLLLPNTQFKNILLYSINIFFATDCSSFVGYIMLMAFLINVVSLNFTY